MLSGGGRGGLALRVGRVTAVLAPEVAYARNLGFQSQPAFLTGQRPATGSFAAQWFVGPYSADLPIRFGDQSYTVVGFGQSHVAVAGARGRVAAGFSTENEWWGPGVRNALLMSNAAEGFAHAFVRTARPLRTRLGDVEARWVFGAPTRSLYFGAGNPAVDSAPDGRILNGAVATLRIAAEPGLTVGVARLVLTPARGAVLSHVLDVLTRNNNLGAGDTLTRLRSDQLAPVLSGAYTLGAARAWRGPAAGTMRGSLEVTNLEQSRVYTDRPPPPDYYTGRAAPAGFTSRGQPLGAAIGPGSQSQWAALDYYRPRWQAGAFAQRTRHQNDALTRVFVPNAFRHDVSLAGGVRQRGVDARATLTFTKRLNYLFQNGTYNTFRQGSVDVSNVTFGMSVSPAPRPAR